MNYKQANAASPAGVAWQMSTKSIGLSPYELCHVVVTDSQIFMFEHAGNIDGDDWEPLVPAADAKLVKALQAENESLKRDVDFTLGRSTALQATIAKLREQLAGKYVLGEPCKYHAIGNGNYYLARNRSNGEWRIGKCFAFAAGNHETYDYWPWTPPTLPEPEPVPEVPKWEPCVWTWDYVKKRWTAGCGPTFACFGRHRCGVNYCAYCGHPIQENKHE